MLELDDALIQELARMGRSIYKFLDGPGKFRLITETEPTPTQGVVLAFDSEWSMPDRIYAGQRIFGLIASHTLLPMPRYPSFLTALGDLFVIEELPPAEAANYLGDWLHGPAVRLVDRKPVG